MKTPKWRAVVFMPCAPSWKGNQTYTAKIVHTSERDDALGITAHEYNRHRDIGDPGEFPITEFLLECLNEQYDKWLEKRNES